MLRCAIAVHGPDGRDFAFNMVDIGQPPSGKAWELLGVEYWDIDNQGGIVWECGVYAGKNVDNPESDIEADEFKLHSWGLVQPKWAGRGSGLVEPHYGLYSGRSEVVAYIRKESSGVKNVLAWIYYDEVKVTQETLIGLRRVGGYAAIGR
jgi:hypothetical protein